MDLSQPSSGCLMTSLQPLRASAKSRAPVTRERMASPCPWCLQLAGQPLCCHSCSLLPASPNLPAPRALVMCLQLAMPETGRWIDGYQSGRQPSLGRAAQASVIGARSSYFESSERSRYDLSRSCFLISRCGFSTA